MIAAGATIPGIHKAISMTLRMNGTREVLPLMAQLLDSPDPDAQLRAAAYFVTSPFSSTSTAIFQEPELRDRLRLTTPSSSHRAVAP